jgi:hypothetical protein
MLLILPWRDKSLALLLVLFFAMLTAENTLAASADLGATNATTSKSVPVASDNWYFIFSAGLVPQPQHDSAINNEIHADQVAYGFAGEYAAILEPGIYHRFGQSYLLGVAANFIFENYAHKFDEQSSLAISTYSANISGLSFTGPAPGLGYFARFDIGPSELVRIREQAGNFTRSYFAGVLTQIGFGYGFQSSLGSRMLVDMRYAYEGVTDHYFSAVSVNLGVLL